jgi:stage II sporulation protein D
MIVLTAALALSGVSLGGPDDRAAASTAVTATGSSFTFTGSGWGHGVGMSQWGARGMAESGHGHDQILGHYYSGSAVTTRSVTNSLRVLIAQRASTLTLRTGAHTTFNDVGNLSGGNTVTLTRSGSGIRLSGAIDATTTSPLTVRYAGGELTVVEAGHRYRHGQLVVRTDPGGGLRASIEALGMQEYLYGLAEMPATWHLEALEAQVVAARTFAQKKRDERAAAGWDFDLYATTVDQVYSGVTHEHARWKSAVDATAGQVVTAGGKLIDAVYSSSSGGHTEHSENVWVSALPYLRGKPDPYDGIATNPHRSWSRTYTGAQLGTWFGLGTVSSVSILGPFGVSGRVDKATIRLTGTGGTKNVTGAVFRATVNSKLPFGSQLLSTRFSVVGAAAATASPPTGDFHTAIAQGRTIVIGGRASDPDGVPLVKVVSTMGTQRAERHTRPVDGSFLVAWEGAPGTRQVCVTVVDVPTGTDHSLGCRNVVVK